MQSISAALENLQAALAADFPDSPGVHIVDVAFPLNDSFDPLSWLCSQHCWPQFYWQQRNGDDEIAALGAVKSFTSLAGASRFLQEPELPDDLRICGMNAFNPQQGALFLPRLEWRRNAGNASLRLVLYSDRSLRDDATRAREFFASLKEGKLLPQLQVTLQAERHHPDHPHWIQLVSDAIATIGSGALDKVVLARATDLTFTDALNAGAIMAASRRLNLRCYHFYQAFDAGHAFLGSSPERLWRRRGKLLRTEALAGTVASHPDEAQAQLLADWLMKDDKNQRENMLVVEDICQRLQTAVQTLEVLPPQVVTLRKVQHLRRCIWTELAQADDELCLHLLQPTAAVAGLPRTPARAWIEQHEPFTRGWYAGSAGYLSRQQSEFCVALRSAKVDGKTLRLYAGAGIVSGSDPEQEWQEIDNKAAGLRTLLFD
ncbi:menaquinone-specific isochorismate synthase [Trabulsiella guamensis ATCC 49490]|uniref:Isochorismate synthase MenF n=1 Tax=Trabulsiella guamensis ATCC 49490 TaxID=1005994 RepID=A0A085A9S4_9ENTR|nr:isochorismate synthase MenF [Trabulsiella guamensis]KFC06969.1 menaquinone-specific isochorismate synthase [Trabulsiella guamensis ATCC 49490]